jgi:XTP/dITP diphosphohydrolase
MKIAIVTSNQGKLREFRASLEGQGIEVVHADLDCDEIQADTLQEVVVDCLGQLSSCGIKDLALDDSGLFIDHLKGFPGVYSSYALRTLGNEGVLKLLEGVKDRGAHFECCIGCMTGDFGQFIVTGRCEGTIGLKAAGNEGFGFDPIFIPQGYDRTFAEISIEEKNRISHRGKALQAFSQELIGRRRT